VALCAAALLGGTPRVSAHEGPPYPILVDRVTGPYRVSVWADPDVGTGTFHVYLEPASSVALPDPCDVQVLVRPADGRLPEAGYPADPRRPQRGSRRFEAKAQFDREGPWNVRFRVSSAAGLAEADTLVAVTPPGQGPFLDFAIYLFPFVAVAFLFLKASLRRRSVG
jgi:hypothetical protein